MFAGIEKGSSLYSSGEQGLVSLPLLTWPWGLALVSMGWDGSGRVRNMEGWTGVEQKEVKQEGGSSRGWKPLSSKLGV